jgi:hypothetical protein
MPADFARAGRGASAVSFHGKNTRLKASAPAIIIRQIKQASSVGGLIAARLLRTGTGSCARFFVNSFRSFVQKSEQPASCFNVRLGNPPFVFAAVHGPNHAAKERQGVVETRQGNVRE